jgi:glycine/D-amino acid oxidase-like deaminating enzyme
MVLAKGRYAIPRRDGHILVGSTLEHEGYDKTPTAEALASLKASAIELLPALADAKWLGTGPACARVRRKASRSSARCRGIRGCG